MTVRFQNFDGFNFEHLEDIERYEQFKLALERHLGSLMMCAPDEDRPLDYARWETILNQGYSLLEKLEREILLFYGEKISPDAPMLAPRKVEK